MTTVRRAIKKNRGVAILLALFFMILLSLIGIALIGMVPVELRSSTRTKLDLQAHYAVTTGIRQARAWVAAVMTPTGTTGGTTPDDLGDNLSTVDSTGTSIYNSGASRINDITGVDGTSVDVEFTPMRLSNVYASNLIPKQTANWTNVYDMLNIPSSGGASVDGNTVVLVKKAPLVLGEWSAYTVIIPDADTPGGINTQDGSHHITTFFGGSGKAGRRCYQLITLAFYQGFPTLRGKSTVLEDSFARYSLFVNHDASGGWLLQALPGQTTTLGPVHTNETFKFGIDPAVWGQSATDPVPFNGLMTFGQYADASSGVVASLNHDGAVYSQGNDANGEGTQYRPFDNSGNDPSGRYNKMISGGRSNLRQTTTVKLPPDSAKLANAAFGTNYTTGLYSSAAVQDHVAPVNVGGNPEPDGLFVFPNTSGKAAGGVVVKGDQRNMFLEVVDSDARPITNLTALEAGTATGNPGIRVQASKNKVGTVTTTATFPGGTTTTSTSVGETVTSYPSTQVVSSSTGTTTITNSGPKILYGTTTNYTPTSSVGTTYLKSTQTNTYTTPKTTLTSTSTGTSLLTLGGAGAGTQTITLYSTFITTTGSGTSTNKTTYTTSTQYNTTPYTITNSGSFSTGVTTTTHYTPLVLNGTATITTSVTGTSTIYAPATITNPPSTSTGLTTVTFKPMDQLVEVQNTAITLKTNMFQTSTNELRDPIGAHTGSSNPQRMDVSKVAGITELLMVGSGGAVTPMTGDTTVGTGTVVVIKQSRTDPSKALVFLLPADANQDGDLLNGAVYSEGNIGQPDASGSNQRGLAGINMGRKTIGTQIETVGATNSTDPFDKHFGEQSKTLGIVNNLFQYGTKLRESDPDKLKADNGLGLVGEDIRITADPDQFNSFWDPTTLPNYNSSGSNNKFLNIHAVLLAGSQIQGGLTVNGFQDINQITPSSIGAGGTKRTPLVRFVGGLIVQNYFGRINGTPGQEAGWTSKNVYNQQLALNPPPYFPNNGLLIPLSYIEERIWSEQHL